MDFICRSAYKSVDFHLPLLPAVVLLHFQHNHNIIAADALKFRSPSLEITEKFHLLFQAGHNPAKALAIHQEDLQQEHEDEFYSVAADRAICPDIQWVFHQYYFVFKKEYGSANGDEMLTKLRCFVNDYNASMKENCAQMRLFDDGNFVVCLVSPLMKRVLLARQSSEVLFVDSTSNVDRFGCRVFLLMVNSCAGGLPIGVLITSSESENTLNESWKIYKGMISENAFWNRGLCGPHVIMTDDCAALRASLARAFPDATVLLCTFHVLQAAWRYLWNASTGVPLNKRQELFGMIKKLLYSSDTQSLADNYTKICQSEEAGKYPKYFTYVENRFERREEWAICYRKNLVLRGQNTNNFCEAAMRILKDKILTRTKAYSVVQLFDFLATDFDMFYSHKAVSVAAGRPESYIKKKNNISEDKTKSLSYSSTGSNSSYEVKNSTSGQVYNVDTQIGLCTCPVGETGGLCKHQLYLSKTLNLQLPIALPTTPEDRKEMHFIGTGSREVPRGWFAGLTQVVDHDRVDHDEEAIVVVDRRVTDAEVAGTCSSDKVHTSSIRSPSARKEQIFSDYDQMTEKFKLLADKNPDFLDALGNMVASSKMLHTEDSCISACNTFGKYSRGLRKSKLHSTKTIGVQPTAYVRRKTVCGGRHQMQSGRPPKRAFTSEHGYPKALNSILMPHKKARNAAPHNLAESVNQNKSLGKRH